MKKQTTFPSTLTIPRIYQTFRKYIEENTYFRIFFFPGKGYLWVTAENESDTITTQQQMISKLMDNIIDDIVFSTCNVGHVEKQLSEKEKTQIRLFLGHILMEADEEETAFYFECLEHQMIEWEKPYPSSDEDEDDE